MSLLSHQSFANPTTPYWASANQPTSLVSPLSVVDTYGVPTKNTVITANGNGTGGIFYANQDGTNPLGMAFAQGATQPSNQLIFDIGNVNPVLSLTSSNAIFTEPIVLDSALNAQDFTILPTPGGVEMQMGGITGSVISMNNGPAGAVSIMGASTFLDDRLTVADKFNNSTIITSTQVQFKNATADAAQVGLTGTSAFLGTNTAPLTTPGVLVNISNGAELQFTDTTSVNVYGMKSVAGSLLVSTPTVSNAITVASNGTVTIPDIVSGSFVPIGGIVMFSGNPLTLPANWKICDGIYPGTPDLTNKFIIGVGIFPLGTAGGSATIDISNLPAHNHGVTDPGHTHAITDPGHLHGITDPGHFHTTTAMSQGNEGINGTAFGRLGNNQGNNSDTKTTGITINTATTSITVNTATTSITTNNTGSGQAYYPPFYALAYIMRVA